MVILTSREEVMAFLQKYNSPLLQCEFVMSISQIKEQGIAVSMPTKVLVTSFDCPDSGIYWAPQTDKFGFVKAALKYSQLNVSYISPIGDTLSVIHEYYDTQFTEDGLLKASNKDFASIDISAMASGDVYQLFHCEGCRFSYPIPQVDLSVAKASVYRTVISYNSFRYGI